MTKTAKVRNATASKKQSSQPAKKSICGIFMGSQVSEFKDTPVGLGKGELEFVSLCSIPYRGTLTAVPLNKVQGMKNPGARNADQALPTLSGIPILGYLPKDPDTFIPITKREVLRAAQIQGYTHCIALVVECEDQVEMDCILALEALSKYDTVMVQSMKKCMAKLLKDAPSEVFLATLFGVTQATIRSWWAETPESEVPEPDLTGWEK